MAEEWVEAFAVYSSADHSFATSGLLRRKDGRQKNGGKKISGLHVFAPIFLPFPLRLASRSGRPSLSVESVPSVVTFLWLRLAALWSSPFSWHRAAFGLSIECMKVTIMEVQTRRRSWLAAGAAIGPGAGASPPTPETSFPTHHQTALRRVCRSRRPPPRRSTYHGGETERQTAPRP